MRRSSGDRYWIEEIGSNPFYTNDWTNVTIYPSGTSYRRHDDYNMRGKIPTDSRGKTIIFHNTNTSLDGREALFLNWGSQGPKRGVFGARVFIPRDEMPGPLGNVSSYSPGPGDIMATRSGGPLVPEASYFVFKGEEPNEEPRQDPAEERRLRLREERGRAAEEERERELAEERGREATEERGREAADDADDDRIAEVLQKFDRDGNGKLEMKEFGHLLQCLDSASWSEDKIGQLFRMTDGDDSGCINIEELTGWLSGISSEDKTAIFQANPSRLCDNDYDIRGEDATLDGLLDDEINPRVPLKKAMGALPPDVKKELKKPYWFAKKFARGGKCRALLEKYSGLDADGASAIYLYTMETPLYKELNKQLRSRDRASTVFQKHFYPFSRILIEALRVVAAAGPGKQTLNRGVRLDLVSRDPDEMQTGSTRIFWSFTSCTASADALSNPTFLGTTGDRTLFQISTRKGAPIGEFSSYPEEAEYLLPPGTVLLIKGILVLGGGLTLIQLEDDDEAPDLLSSDW